MDDNDKLILAVAKAIEGPHNSTRHLTDEKMDELRDVRWGMLNAQDRHTRLQQARAALTVARGFA